MHSPHLSRLFLRRFLENDLVSPDADRVAVISQVCAGLITGGLFVTVMLSLQYLESPFPLPNRTSVQMIRVQYLYSAWSMVVMALVAVFAWDALALDSRDTAILGPLPVKLGTILKAKISALLIFMAAFAAALNMVPAIVHPVLAVSRLRPSLLAIPTLVVAHLASTIGAAAFGFAVVLGLREILHALVGTRIFRRISLVVQSALVVVLLTMMLLVPGFSFRATDQWLSQGTVEPVMRPPLWFVGIHDAISGHVWEPLPRPRLPPRFIISENALRALYRDRRPALRQLGFTGAAGFLIVVLCSSAGYLWNNRRLPDPPHERARHYSPGHAIFDRLAQRLVARRQLVRAGFFFAFRVLGRSAQNRLPVAVALAVAIAVGTLFLRSGGTTPLFAIQTLFLAALAGGFRHAMRIPAELRARWLLHFVRPADQSAYLVGTKRAALIKLMVPMLVALLPLHVLALGWRTAVLRAAFGFLLSLVLMEALLLKYRRLPFASSYVPDPNINTKGPIVAIATLIGVYALASIESVASSSPAGIAILFGTVALALAVLHAVDAWQRREDVPVDLDELVEPPTLRLELSD